MPQPRESARRPSELMAPGLSPDDCTLVVGEGIYGEVRDASKVNRATAAAQFAREAGVSFHDVRCTSRYMRWLTRQDVWDQQGAGRWLDGQEWKHRLANPGLHESIVLARFQKLGLTPPAEPPEDWAPGEEDTPCWTFVPLDHPDAVHIWVCEVVQ